MYITGHHTTPSTLSAPITKRLPQTAPTKQNSSALSFSLFSGKIGNRLICDSLASRDIDDTINEEEEEEEGDEEDYAKQEPAEDASQKYPDGGDNSGRDPEEVVIEGGRVSTMSDCARARDRRSNSRSRELDNSRIKSRSVSPGFSVASAKHGLSAESNSGNQSRSSNRRSGSSELAGSNGSSSRNQHDYVNSAPGGTLVGTPGNGFGAGSNSGGFGSIPAIPPPPQKQQQSFNRQQHPLISIDSDPYGKEFDAISTDSSRISAAVPAAAPTAGSRINGRVVPPSQPPQQPLESSKELIALRLRNGFV